MVAYLGNGVTSLGAAIKPDRVASSVSAFTLRTSSVVGVGEITKNSGGQKTFNQIVASPKTTNQGAVTKGVGCELFGDVIVWPRTIDLGLVLSAKLFNIGVWNLTGRAQRLLSWSVIGLDGLTISNADGYPAEYGQERHRNYQVNVGATGSAQLSGSIVFTFQGISTGTGTSLTGSRLIIFGFRPNWREPVKERLEWLTDVLTAYNEREQRLQLRADPRRAMRYLFTFKTAEELSYFQGTLWGWQSRVFAVPIWTDWQHLGASLNAGSASIPVTTTYRDFNAGGLALIWREYNTWEVVEILSVSSGSLTLTKPIVSAWDPMDRIIPLRTGRLDKNLAVSRPNDAIGEANITFTYEVGDAVGPNRLGVSSHTQYNGLDVYLVRPNVADDPTDTYLREINVVDFGKGGWSVFDRSNAPRTTRTYSHVFSGRQNIANFLAFLETRKGQLKPLYVPTWTQDMEQMADIGASDSNLVIRNINYTRQIKTHPNRSSIILFPADGSAPIIREVLSCSEGANNTEILTLDAAFGSLKVVGSFKSICFLVKCRMSTDDFDLTWHSDSVLTVDFSCVEVLV